MQKQEENNKYQGLLYGGQYEELTNSKDPWGFRGISQEVCERFGVKVVREGDKASVVFPYYDANGNMIAQKVRRPNQINENTGKKKRVFQWLKADADAMKNITLFGAQRYKAGKGKITIVFGEFDALAVAEMMGDFPVVSVPNGDDASIQSLKDNFRYLDRFEEIVLCPDNDESGRKVIDAVSAMFMRKIRVMRWDDASLKDANDFLKAGKAAEFKNIWWSAPSYMPEKIKDFSALRSKMTEKRPEPIADYPFEALNTCTGGIWAGDLVVIKAKPKVGKSSWCNEVVHHLLKTTTHKIGLIYLEEHEDDLVYRFVSMEMGTNLLSPVMFEQTTEEDRIAAFDSFEKDAHNRLFYLDHWGSCSSEFLKEKIREFVIAKGVQFIFFDHISMAITDESNKDERVALDRLVSEVKSLTVGIRNELPDGVSETVRPTIFMVTHVNDAGQTRGSRAALQMCNLLISLTRLDENDDDPAVKDITKLTVEAQRRPVGPGGDICYFTYDFKTGRVVDRTEFITTSKEEKK